MVGYNSRLDELQAAILRVKLRRLNDWNGARREHAAAFSKLDERFVLLIIGIPKENQKEVFEYVQHLALLKIES